MIRSLLGCIAFAAGTSFAASVQLPGNLLTIPALSTTGASFTYSGTLTQADTITFTQTGNPCLQAAGTGYCANGAGVLTVAATFGGTPVGGTTTFSGPSGVIPAGTWVYGSLLMQISGVGTVRVFPANATNGLGSPTPPQSLTVPTTSLSALGFPVFSQVNPTITFIVADTGFTDNGGQFVLSQVAAPVVVTPVPTLGGWTMTALIVLLAAIGVVLARRRVRL